MKQISINIPSPFKVLTLGILSYFFLYIISPLTPIYVGTLYSWSYLIFCILALYLGLALGYKRFTFKSKVMYFNINTKTLKKVLKIILFIAIVGVLLRIIDKYYLRGATLALDIVANREALISQGSGLISIISAVLYPFTFIIFFYYLFLKRIKAISSIWLLLVVPVALFPIVDGLFFGSRSSALVFITLIVFYLGVFDIFKLKFNIKTFIASIVFFLIIFSFSGYMFSFRTESLHMDPILSTQISAYAHFVQLDTKWTDFLYSINGNLIYYFSIGIINFIQYVIHGIFELLFMVDNFNTEKLTYGGQNFFIILKFFSKLFGFDLSFVENSLVRKGIYTTFFGPTYYDFGYFGIIFNLFFGMITGRLALNIVKKNKVTLIPLYLYMLVILFFTLVVSLLVSAQGIYIIVAFYLSHLIAQKYLKKYRVASNQH